MELKNISFTYESDYAVLKNLSLKLERGEILGVLGHNGSGKSTLIKCMAGILKPDSGEISPSLKKARISYTPELNGLYERLSVYRNIRFRAEISGLPKSKFENSINELLSKFVLESKKDSPISDLSNGMKKRLSLACSMVSEPDILLLDEPTNGLDAQSIDSIKGFISDLRSSGVCTIINSHDFDFVSSLCDRVIILENGHMRCDTAIKGMTREEVKDLYFAHSNDREDI